MFLTIIIFIIILGVLVLVHEGGHFFVAKRSGMKVEEFGFGFPPRIAGIQKIDGKIKWVWGHREPMDKEHTVYSINWIPFGGFVKILGENNEGEEDPRSFINKPFWSRFFTLIAGVSMNWILAAVLFSIVFAVGVTSEIDPSDPAMARAHITNQQTAISYIADGMPAQKAGLQEGDIILSIDGHDFTNIQQVQDYINANKGKDFQFIVKRLSETKTLDVQSQSSPRQGEGPTGIGLTEVGTVRVPWYTAIGLGVERAANLTVVIVQGVYHLFTSKAALSEVGGPVKIAQLTGEVASLGFIPLLNFTGLLSINLAILNILPIPALDGGRILFLLIEKIRRKRNNQAVEQWVNAAGFLALIFLMILVTIKDINGFGGVTHVFRRLFGG
ncbi:MAG: RIP metalloprotease RseP [Patescibacteria group bacterium]|nr:RIP metalloprotease RseP [Patescibacteria group bacterium]